MREKIKKLVAAYVYQDMPEDIKHLVAHANADLHFGPVHNGLDPDAPFPGFSSACETIQQWINNAIPYDLWVDLDCEMVWDRAPEGYYDGEEWIEPNTEDIYQVDRKQILRYAFGELADYL